MEFRSFSKLWSEGRRKRQMAKSQETSVQPLRQRINSRARLVRHRSSCFWHGVEHCADFLLSDLIEFDGIVPFFSILIAGVPTGLNWRYQSTLCCSSSPLPSTKNSSRSFVTSLILIDAFNCLLIKISSFMSFILFMIRSWDLYWRWDRFHQVVYGLEYNNQNL